MFDLFPCLVMSVLGVSLWSYYIIIISFIWRFKKLHTTFSDKKRSISILHHLFLPLPVTILGWYKKIVIFGQKYKSIKTFLHKIHNDDIYIKWKDNKKLLFYYPHEIWKIHAFHKSETKFPNQDFINLRKAFYQSYT